MTNILGWIIFISATSASFLYMSSLKKTVMKGQIDNTPLSKKEKWYVLVIVVITPLIGGAIFYYGWIKRLPKKADIANRYSIAVGVFEAIIFAFVKHLN